MTQYWDIVAGWHTDSVCASVHLAATSSSISADLRVGVHDPEFDAEQLADDHPVDGVGAAAADADDLHAWEDWAISNDRGEGATGWCIFRFTTIVLRVNRQ